MKKLLIASSLLIAATFSTAAFAFTINFDDPLPDFMVLTDRAHAGNGMTSSEVDSALGAPSVRISEDVWVYWDFKANNVPAAEKYDTLVVVFSQGRVVRLRLCDSKPVRAFIAQQQKLQKAQRAVATK